MPCLVAGHRPKYRPMQEHNSAWGAAKEFLASLSCCLEVEYRKKNTIFMLSYCSRSTFFFFLIALIHLTDKVMAF